jgi:putative hydrolase of the HAD superfamily
VTLQALVLDFGGPVLCTAFEILGPLERRLGLAPGTFGWTGPFDPAKDPLWRSMQADEITEVNYWERRADEVAAVTGRPGVRAMMAQLYPADELNAFVRRQAYETVRAVRAACVRTGVLTNDLSLFYDDESITRINFLDEVDVVVDCYRTGVLKPDPAAYRLVLNSLDVPAETALFVDDQPRNIYGARAIGMPALLFDVTRPSESWREVIRLLGLSELDQV